MFPLHHGIHKDNCRAIIYRHCMLNFVMATGWVQSLVPHLPSQVWLQYGSWLVSLDGDGVQDMPGSSDGSDLCVWGQSVDMMRHIMNRLVRACMAPCSPHETEEYMLSSGRFVSETDT